MEPLYDEIIDSLNDTLDSISRFATGHDPDAAETDDAKLERLGYVYDVIKAQHAAFESDTDRIRQSNERLRQLETEIEEVRRIGPEDTAQRAQTVIRSILTCMQLS